MNSRGVLSSGSALLVALPNAFALAFVIGISVAAASQPFYLLIAACLAGGCVLGFVTFALIARVMDPSLLSLASYGPLLVGFGMFAVTGGLVFIIGLSFFLLGVALCGVGLGGTVKFVASRT